MYYIIGMVVGLSEAHLSSNTMEASTQVVLRTGFIIPISNFAVPFYYQSS